MIKVKGDNEAWKKRFEDYMNKRPFELTELRGSEERKVECVYWEDAVQFVTKAIEHATKE